MIVTWSSIRPLERICCTLAQLTKVNEAGEASMLRQGLLLDIHGFAIRESAQVREHNGWHLEQATRSTTPAAYAIGATTIALDTWIWNNSRHALCVTIWFAQIRRGDSSSPLDTAYHRRCSRPPAQRKRCR